MHIAVKDCSESRKLYSSEGDDCQFLVVAAGGLPADTIIMESLMDLTEEDIGSGFRYRRTEEVSKGGNCFALIAGTGCDMVNPMEVVS